MFPVRYVNRIARGVADARRTILALRQTEGKRLKYRATIRRDESDLPWRDG